MDGSNTVLVGCMDGNRSKYRRVQGLRMAAGTVNFTVMGRGLNIRRLEVNL